MDRRTDGRTDDAKTIYLRLRRGITKYLLRYTHDILSKFKRYPIISGITILSALESYKIPFVSQRLIEYCQKEKNSTSIAGDILPPLILSYFVG